MNQSHINSWGAGYIERCMSGSMGDSQKPSVVIQKGVGFLPYNKAEKMFPETTTITVKVNHTELEQFLTDLSYIRAGMAKKHQTVKDGQINKYLSINLNDVHMDQYLRNGFVTQKTIDLIKSDNYSKITTLA